MSTAEALAKAAAKQLKTLNTVLDSEGREVIVEEREDTEAKTKFQETVDLLVAAGYFRARIKGLSAFDKIVGGMTWCISTCSVDVDVDLLFQENSSIGAKIALTEKIVGTLPRMKCPHRLEPHQIQGLDYIHIFPVVQWLVKKALETKAETGDAVRAYALSQFDRQFGNNQKDRDERERVRRAVPAIRRLREIYRPRRRFRRGAGGDVWSAMDESTRVSSTLMEFGRSYRSTLATEEELDETVEGAEEAKSSSKTAALAWDEETEMRIATLLQEVSGGAAGDLSSNLSAKTVGNIVGMQSQEIQRVAMEYDAKKTDLIEEAKTPEMVFEEKSSELKTTLADLDAKRLQLTKKLDEARADDADVDQRLGAAHTEADPFIQRRREFEELKAAAGPERVKTLEHLVETHDEMKKREAEFKASCKEQLAVLRETLAKAQSDAEGDAVFDEDADADVIKAKGQIEKEVERASKLKAALAKKSRQLRAAERQLDEIPSRAELEQYQKRFLELYDESAAVHRQTKQFFSLYNTLDDKRRYLEKEVNVLESIHDNFEKAMSTPAGKEEFLQQLANIVEGIGKNKQALERKKAGEKAKLDEVAESLAALVEKKRLYFKMVKEFQDECKKNDSLMSK